VRAIAQDIGLEIFVFGLEILGSALFAPSSALLANGPAIISTSSSSSSSIGRPHPSISLLDVDGSGTNLAFSSSLQEYRCLVPKLEMGLTQGFHLVPKNVHECLSICRDEG
jgi:hypothetical protein